MRIFRLSIVVGALLLALATVPAAAVTISGCGYVGPGADTYVLAADLSCNISSGAAITLPSGSTLDGQGFKVANTNGTGNSALGILAANASNVTVKNVAVSGFMYGVYFQGHSGTGHRLLDSDLTGYFRGARVEGQDWEIGRVVVHDVGGTTFPNFLFSFGIEVYGRGVIHNVRVTNTFAAANSEAVSISVSEYANLVSMIDLDLWNPTKNAKSIGLWVGGAAPKPDVTLTDVFISNMDNGVYGTATVTARNVHQHNVGNPWNLSTGEFIDAGSNYPVTTVVPPPPPPPPMTDLIPVMTGNPTDGVSVTTSSSAVYPAWNAAAGPTIMQQFSGGAGAGWVRFDLPASAVATQFSLRARSNEPRWAAKDFQLICNATSGDVVLTTITGAPAWSAGEQRTYTFSNALACPAYTLNLTASREAPYLQISDVKIAGPP